ncbi:hypothetical protein JW960_21245 [candidate division KSB1 bacterium]|nr:hypothetical protein [candidate division KSB1 bacterium]
MKNLLTIILFVFIIQFSLAAGLQAQGKLYDGPDDPAGDIAAEREGYMTGNRVLLYFRNTTELSDWPRVEVSKWPNTYNGVKMIDGIGLLIGAMVFMEQDTIPVTDLNRIRLLAAQGQLDTLYYLQTSYREEMDVDPTGTVEWGLYPVFGYFNDLEEYPAMSNRPESWPTSGWPASNSSLKWPGEWDGRFGRGVIYADLETYFVANDAQDQEYLGPEDRVKYYPRPGVKIGDKRPNVSIQAGAPWGGVGLRVQQRGFQWNNPQAQDAIFWEYTIANISDYDLTQVGFGYWVDNAIGDAIAGAGDDDELGFFDTRIDLAYSWDIDGIGQGGFPTGTMGFAYLESPGLAYDNIDNDQDGLLDEKRDNVAISKVGPQDGIYNLADFLSFYHLNVDQLVDHWDADEDQDWEDGDDTNGDGVYQSTEFYGDDVGLDGVGPNELNYDGPDEGECNHKPDYQEGLGCEPNFAVTDVTESDMVGLTSFLLFRIPPHNPPYTRWFRNDKSMWEMVGRDTLIESVEWTSNLVELFASGPFPLYKGRTERISMSELHSYDALEGLSSSTHIAPALFEAKRIVQVIYEEDYRFAQPPKMPTLIATAGDGKVILTWDNVADTRTRDPFMGNENDFEGYKLYRATDKKMADAELITDGFGTPFLKKPIYQCDLKDGKYGFTNFGLINGVAYHLGYETGITHYFVDENVQNGRTYYYALAAYDYGAPDIGTGISPSENNVAIELDESENVKVLSDGTLAIGKNVQIVTPRQPAAGYVPPSVDMESESKTLGSGVMTPQILAANSLNVNHTYTVKFGVHEIASSSAYPHGSIYTNDAIYVYDKTAGNQLVYEENSDKYYNTNLVYKDTTDYTRWQSYWYLNPEIAIETDIFDGIRLNIQAAVEVAEYDYMNSGWLVGSSPILVTPTIEEYQLYAWDYDIVFTDNDSAYIARTTPSRVYDDQHTSINRTSFLTKAAFPFYVLNKSFTDANGDYEMMDLIVHDRNKNGVYDMIDDRVMAGAVDTLGNWVGTAFSIDFSLADAASLPKNGDVFRVRFIRPFWKTDSLTFTVKPEGELNVKALRATMNDIQVVPNPYVATNTMETSVANWYLNQHRQIMFINLPAKCTIKIFTVSGVLVDEINVNNTSDRGIAHWDLTSREGLEVAAGMYIYHVKAEDTDHVKVGDVEKIGKFAIIK